MTRFRIADFQSTPQTDTEMTELLTRVYVDDNYTHPIVGERLFRPEEVKSRGPIMVATSDAGTLLGVIICGLPGNPYQQVAKADEAEMHLLAVDPASRGSGLGEALCQAFEEKALSLGYKNLVLSTQATMTSAQKLYEKLGYNRDSQRDWSSGGRDFLVYHKSVR